MTELEDHFTVFIRLPFPRGSFVDPPTVDWSASKERELWEVLSKSTKGHEIDWEGLSQRFQVTESFLLQQAAWLYERQLSQVRAQMRRMGSRSSNTASPLPSTTTSQVGSQAMKRTGSGGSRVPSRLSTQLSTDGSPATSLRAKSSFTTRPQPQPIARTDSKDGIHSLSRRTSKESEIASRTHSRRGSVQHQITRSPKQEVQDTSSSEEDMTKSRMLHRRPNPAASRRLAPRKPQHTRRPSAPQLDEEDEEEDSPAFLPISATSTETAKPDNETSATVRATQAQRPSTYRKSTSERIPQTTEQLTSSASSTSEVPGPARPRTSESRPAGRGNLPNPLSPTQQAALAAQAGLSPRLRRGNNGQGSDTSPSMGSSFSDLDDASVTQSALEEAILSMGNTTMTVGGPSTVGNMANRVSGIGQAFRSRCFDARQGEDQSQNQR